jgi:hypothetical protein
MATNSKVFVSPGVYTSEVDLSFVAQSVGVTTLGIVGETLKGPAFEPIFITNFDEFSTYFGGTSAEKFINTQIPKYEAAYIAKSYLQQSNQLFVTRVLGLSGYDAGPSWSITTKANVDPTTVGFNCTSSSTVNCVTECVTFQTIEFDINFTGCSDSISSIGFTNTSQIPSMVLNRISTPMELFNGSTTTLQSEFNNQIYDIILDNGSSSGSSIYYYGVISGETYDSLSGYTAQTNVFGTDSNSSTGYDYTDSNNDPWYYALFDNNSHTVSGYSGYSFYSNLSSFAVTSTSNNCATFYSMSVDGVQGSINYNTNTIDVCLPVGTTLGTFYVGYSACTEPENITVNGTVIYDNATPVQFSSGTAVFQVVSNDGTVTEEWTVNTTVSDPCNPCTIANTGTGNVGSIKVCYQGTLSGTIFVYSGTPFLDYDDLVIATLRSRGVANYSTDNGAVYEVTGTSDVTLITTGSTYSASTKNPYSKFGINVTNNDGDTFQFQTSFTNSDSEYLPKVFGSSNFSKPRQTVPLFVEERYQNLLNYGWRKGYIRGISSNITALPDARQGSDPTSIAWYLEQYQSAQSPWVVSELRGNNVYNLFRFVTISDGDDANTEVKVSIANISFANGTFDVLVRDYFDSDNSPSVLEKFTNCSMNPNENNFIAIKIGTSNGEFALNSKYIMLEMNEDAPVDALPCGFLGYTTRQYAGVIPPFPIYKTKYDFPGEVIYNPPFGTASGADDATTSAGDNVRRTYLGISDTIGYDIDFFLYKGKQLPLNICTDTTGDDWGYRTKGYHMDSRATGITIPNSFTTSGTAEFYVGASPFSSEPENADNQYYRLFARKFTVAVAGGFDGWDIYREYRTNSDRFVIGKSGYLKGACPSIKYPNATGWGAFKQITVGDNTQDFGNTDYYAYLLGQKTFSNPEAVNINVFVTPGIDYVNNSNLVESAIEMIEFDRADSLYVCTTPDYNMFVPTVGDSADLIYPQEAVDNLDSTGIDSNYTATYYPWVLTRDSVNNTQIYLPATAEVTRNLALTDNIAFPWFAAAGYTRGIVNSVKARKKLTQEDRDTLYKGRINPIATFSDVGTVIWGNKTLQVRESALDRINVRRLLLQARKLISAVSVRLLFEQNDQKVRQDFLDAVNPILDAIRRDRGLYDFRVTVSSDVADLDRNQMTGKIYIKPTRSLEFIDITFYITPTGASFENI